MVELLVVFDVLRGSVTFTSGEAEALESVVLELPVVGALVVPVVVGLVMVPVAEGPAVVVSVAVGAVTALLAVAPSDAVPADPPQALTMDASATALRRGIQSVIHALTISALLRQILVLLTGKIAVRVGQELH